MNRRRGLKFLALCLALVAGGARAAVRPLAKTQAVDRLKQFASEKGLATREIEAGPSFDRVTRLAVELKPEHWAELLQTIGLRKNPETGKFEGALILRQIAGDMAAIGNVGFGNRVFDLTYATTVFSNSHERAVVIDLTPEQADHVGRWLEVRRGDLFLRNRVGNGCSDMIMNIELGPGPDGTHTIRGISEEEAAHIDPTRAAEGQKPVLGSGVPMGYTLHEHARVRRSKQGQQMMAKLIHSGASTVIAVLVPPDEEVRETKMIPTRLPNGKWGERPQVISSIDRRSFAEKDDHQLLGMVHPHGTDAAARQPFDAETSGRIEAFDAALRSARAELRAFQTHGSLFTELETVEARLVELEKADLLSRGFSNPISAHERPALTQRKAEIEAEVQAERAQPSEATKAHAAELEQRVVALETEREAFLQLAFAQR